MLENYSDHLPGNTIKQLLAPDSTASTPAMLSCVVGPRFLLNRYGREDTPADVFNAAGQTLEYKSMVSEIETLLNLDLYSVDQSSLKMYGIGLEATLARFTAASAPSFVVPDLSEPNVLKIDADAVSGSGLATLFRGRNTQVGDIVYCTGINGGTVFRRKVIGLRGAVGSGSAGSNVAADNAQTGNTSSNPVNSSSSATQVSAPAAWTIGCAAPEDFKGLSRGAKNITQYGEKFILTVNTPGTAGVRQVETATVVGTIDASGVGNATVIVTAAGLTGSPLTTSVAVANNDTASQVATKIRAALNGVTAITDLFIVGGAGATVSLTKIVADANDATLNISINNGTCTGLTPALTSVDTTAGSASVATVNIASASGKYNATNIATSTLNGQGTFTITDAAAGGELAGVDLLITPPASEPLAVGQTFTILIIGDYAQLSGSTNVVLGGSYTGVKDTTYMIEVVTTNTDNSDFDGAVVNITDTAGSDTPQENLTIVDGTAQDLGSYGLTFKFDGTVPVQGGLRKGDIYYVHAKAGVVSTTSFDTVVLDGPAVDTLVFTNVATQLYAVEFRKVFTGEIKATDSADSNAWVGAADNAVLDAGLALYVTDRDDTYEWCSYVDAVGKVALSYRAFLLATDVNTVIEVSDVTALVAAAGANDMDNDLGFAAQQMFLGAKGGTIAILNTGGASSDHYAAALATIANTRSVYDLCIMGDPAVWEEALTHAVSCSSEDNRNFRRIRVAADSPGEYSVLLKQADSTNFTCTISPHGGGNKLVTIVAGSAEALLTTRNLVTGDLLKLPDSSATYLVSSVLSDTEFLLVAGPDSAVSPAVTCQIWKADTVASQKSWLIDRAKSLADRRASLVWIEKGIGLVNGVSTVIPARFGAAYISGVRSNLKPQIGTTRQVVATYANAPRMYNRYSKADLNELAAWGIQIITQDYEGAPVRIRHEATTDTSNGILNYEEATTVRLDAFSFLLDDALDVDVGRVNTTEAYVAEARAKTLQVANDARQVPVNAGYGPLIDGFANLSVELSTQFLDRIETSLTVELGPPLNRNAITLTAVGRLPSTTAA